MIALTLTWLGVSALACAPLVLRGQRRRRRPNPLRCRGCNARVGPYDQGECHACYWSRIW